MKKDCIKFNYVLIILSIFIIGGCISSLYVNMTNRVWSDALNRARSTSTVNKKYAENIFNNALITLEAIAQNIEDVDFSDEVKMSKSLRTNDNIFSDISLVGGKGIKLYGSCMYSEFSHSDAFLDALSGRSVINDTITNDHDNKKQICLFVPVIAEGKVKGVLIGAILQNNINNLFEASMVQGGDEMCIIDKNGSYICGSNGFFKAVGSSNGNYLNYLKGVDILKKDKDIYSLKSDITNGVNFEISYKKNSDINISVGEVSKYNGWCIVSTIDAKDANFWSLFTVKDIILVMLLLIDIIAILGIFTYLSKEHHEESCLIEKIETLSKVEGVVFFQYKFSPKCFKLLLNCGKLPTDAPNTLMGESVYEVYDYIHEDDIAVRSSIREFFESGDTMFSSEIRILNSNSGYDWYKLMGTLVKNDIGNNYAFIGKLVDADKQISEEKNLVQRAENDLLTGVLNKKTMEEKITKLITVNKTDRYHIFFMVDLDNFKKVNDTLGHIYGDKAISDTANALSEIFKSNALVGRLGGDEFAVCATYDAFDEESLSQYINKKAEKIRVANQRSYTDGASEVKISSSIGIAVAPVDGNDFEMIYKKADRALYESKNTGKNKYTRFGVKVSV